MRRWVRVAVASLAMPATAVVAIGLVGVDKPRRSQAAVAAARSPSMPAPGSAAAFAVLVDQTSNRCDLQAREIMGYAPDRRLQGSCCSRMDERTYRAQVEALRPYRRVVEIPRDPYDIPVGLAQRLLRYDQRIVLDSAQRATYRRAMDMSRLKGPCCCRCWRWTAFRGLSKYLISQRGYQPARLARLIDALDGCGGQHPATGPAPPSASS